MPIPKPKNKEKEQDYISDCIRTITKEEKEKYPNSKQRAAICYSEWRRAGNKDKKK